MTLLQTNACSPLATNALAGNIWDNFSSQSYKTLPSVGTIKVHDPFTGAWTTRCRPGARLYAAAFADQPVVHRALPAEQHRRDPFEQDPSVDARMRVFQASIEQMLWPEKRKQDPLFGDKMPGDPIYVSIARRRAATSAYLRPIFRTSLRPASSSLHAIVPKLFDADGGITIGPFPAGLPVNLLPNLQPLPESNNPDRTCCEHSSN